MDIETMSDEITDIRERLVKIEVTLDGVQRTVEKDKGNGAIVIPVAVVISAVEVLKVILERLV